MSPTFSAILSTFQVAPLIDALSDAPVFEDHVTTGVPVTPVTVPDSEIAAPIVAAGGASMVRASETAGGEVRVTFTVRITGPFASVAVIVMALGPIASGILKMTQFMTLSEAAPDEPVLDAHVTLTAPVPPLAVPKSRSVEEDVVSGVTLTVRVKGPSPGGTTVPDCGAYRLKMAALSPSARPETILK